MLQGPQLTCNVFLAAVRRVGTSPMDSARSRFFTLRAAGDPRGARPEAGGGAAATAESSPAGRLTYGLRDFADRPEAVGCFLHIADDTCGIEASQAKLTCVRCARPCLNERIGNARIMLNYPCLRLTGAAGRKVKIFEGAETMGDILTRRTAAG